MSNDGHDAQEIQQPERIVLVITVEGGLIQDIITNIPASEIERRLQVIIIDRDTDYAEEDELTTIPEGLHGIEDGEAYVNEYVISTDGSLAVIETIQALADAKA